MPEDKPDRDKQILIAHEEFKFDPKPKNPEEFRAALKSSIESLLGFDDITSVQIIVTTKSSDESEMHIRAGGGPMLYRATGLINALGNMIETEGLPIQIVQISPPESDEQMPPEELL